MLRESDKRRTPAAEFSRRFRLACDESAHVPPKHDGRYVYIIEEYKRRTNEKFAPESVRKWHEGIAMPRPAKIAILAEILGCNAVWLQTGHGDRNEPMLASHDSISTFLDEKSSKSSETAVIPIPLRPGLTIEVRDVPSDLTLGEAKKIANVILAYASVD
jgi:hypothetical protein